MFYSFVPLQNFWGAPRIDVMKTELKPSAMYPLVLHDIEKCFEYVYLDALL